MFKHVKTRSILKKLRDKLSIQKRKDTLMQSAVEFEISSTLYRCYMFVYF